MGAEVNDKLLRVAAEQAISYLDGLPKRRVMPTAQALACLEELNTPLPSGSTSPESVISLLNRVGSPATVATAGGRFFGFVMGGTLPVALAANWLAGAWDQAATSWTASPISAALEEITLTWLLDLFKLPPTSGGAFVTGGTMANFTALAAARHAVLEREGWDVDADGLLGGPPVDIVVSEEAHPSVRKSLGLLGFGRNRSLSIPVDSQGRMRVEAIPHLKKPAIICAQVGNVNTGAVDNLNTICDVAAELEAWVHVDGAFGLWAAAAPSRMYLVEGVERADSWATDAHKWLNVPYDSGLAFVRNGVFLRQAMSVTAPYLAMGPGRQPRDFTPELSRRARGVEVWAALRALGREGLAKGIEQCCAHARRFASSLQAAGYEILNEVVLNQVLVDFGGAEVTRKVISVLEADGTSWFGGTQWQGRTAMRISVSSWATTDADVDLTLEKILWAARSAGASSRTHGFTSPSK